MNQSIKDGVDQEAQILPKEEAGTLDLDAAATAAAAAKTNENSTSDRLLDNDDDDSTELEAPLPEDIFSLIYVSERFGWSFCYSISVYLVQLALIILILLDLLDLDSDNVLKIPPGVNIEVTIAQGVSMVLAVATQTNLLSGLARISVRSSYDHDYVTTHITPQATLRDYTIGVWLQLFVGCLMLVDNFILNMQSSTVQSLMLNFAALAFVSEIQNVAFWVAKHGFVSVVVREDALVVVNFKIPRQHRKETHMQLKRGLFAAITAAMVAGFFFLAQRQRSGHFLCDKMTVQFGDGFRPDLPFFSGTYKQSGGLISDRVVYKNERTGAFFGYCQEIKAWTFAGPVQQSQVDIVNGTIEGTLGNKDPCSYWVRSAETESYDVIATRPADWYVYDILSNQTPPIDYLLMLCTDCEGSRATNACSGSGKCVDNTCVCNNNRMGTVCEYPFPCSTLELDTRTEPFPYAQTHVPATSYELLLNNSSQPVSVYGKPVYVAQIGDNTLALNIILFTGRRWGFFLNLELEDAALDQQLRPGLPDYLPENFHSWLSKYRVYFFSDPMDYMSPSDSGSPVDLQWYKTRRWITIGDRSLYRIDTNQHTNTVLLCPSCLPFFNDCMNEGKCMLNGTAPAFARSSYLDARGTCACPLGFSGTLCEHEDTCMDINGTCFNGGNCTDDRSGRCSCPLTHAGSLCQYNIVEEYQIESRMLF